MNEIIKNDYTKIQKYFDDYYKEQLENYEERKYNIMIITYLRILMMNQFIGHLVLLS